MRPMDFLSRRLAAVLLASLALALLGAASQGSFEPAYDHDLHEAANKQAGLNCVSCHTLGPGGSGPTGMKATLVVEPAALCHGCHQKGGVSPVDGAAVVRGPRPCETCHLVAVVPPSHGAGWKSGHGVDARMDARSCRDCHKQRDCLDCHQRKESAQFRVHDRGWEMLHGIDARTDPTSCDGCHLQADCVACHATDRGRAP